MHLFESVGKGPAKKRIDKKKHLIFSNNYIVFIVTGAKMYFRSWEILEKLSRVYKNKRKIQKYLDKNVNFQHFYQDNMFYERFEYIDFSDAKKDTSITNDRLG